MLDYSRDSAGRLTDYVRGDFGVSPYCSPIGQTWSDQVQARRWDLDGLGNWTHLLTRTGSGDTNETRTRTTFNEYGQVGVVNQGYDDNGNLTGDGAQTYQWDAFNRLRTAFNSQGTTLGVYLYDAGNRRARKTATIQGSTTSTDFYYTGWQTVEERDTPSIPARQYVDGGLYIDEHLLLNVNTNADAFTTGPADARYFYHSNTLYSIYGLSDPTGAIVEAYEYDPYGKHSLIYNNGAAIAFDGGETRSENGSSAFSNSYKLTGRQFAREIALGYYRNRYKGTCFLSRDPLEFKAGANLYQYVRSAPTRSVDPFGLLNDDDTLHFTPPPKKCGTCGPDVTRALLLLDLKVSLDWADWDLGTRLAKCQALYTIGVGETAWDVTELFERQPGSSQCATQDCADTVGFNGGCYSRSVVSQR